jgi:hypothetical protein
MKKVRWVTCRELPEPDVDEELLLGRLRAAGLNVTLAAWEDAAVFEEEGVNVVRSTWNYYRHLPDFLAWVERASTTGTLWNPAEVIRWNCHKQYLLELEAKGVPVIPTECIRRGSHEALTDVLSRRGWSDAVVKPAVSAGSYRTMRVTVGKLDAGATHFASVLAEGDVLVQPYVKSVEGYGERSLIFIDGELTHSVRKSARFLGEEEQVTVAPEIGAEEQAVALKVLSNVSTPLLYARVDLARDEAGRPMLMELELIEPSLFLKQSEAATEKFVAAIARRARA